MLHVLTFTLDMSCSTNDS